MLGVGDREGVEGAERTERADGVGVRGGVRGKGEAGNRRDCDKGSMPNRQRQSHTETNSKGAYNIHNTKAR
jgi:hypothetical protein